MNCIAAWISISLWSPRPPPSSSCASFFCTRVCAGDIKGICGPPHTTLYQSGIPPAHSRYSSKALPASDSVCCGRGIKSAVTLVLKNLRAAAATWGTCLPSCSLGVSAGLSGHKCRKHKQLYSNFLIKGDLLWCNELDVNIRHNHNFNEWSKGMSEYVSMLLGFSGTLLVPWRVHLMVFFTRSSTLSSFSPKKVDWWCTFTIQAFGHRRMTFHRRP